MAHAHFDISPVTVERLWNRETDESAFSVYVYGAKVYTTPFSKERWFGPCPVEDDLKYEWTEKWEKFQVTQFKKWLADEQKEEAEA